YLSSSASSFAAEQTFSSAADRCVSSHMWLKQGNQLTGEFEKAQKTIKKYVDSSQKTPKKYFYFYFLSIILCILYSLERTFNIYILFINPPLYILFVSSSNHNTFLTHYHYLVNLLLAGTR
ncbi:hypothetical protein VP01_5g2, partial [Puccinia sorghi]